MPLPPLDPYWQTTDHKTVRLYQGDVIDVLRRMPAKSVQMVVTSPPYWGLRDYGTAEWEGGDEDCDHINHTAKQAKSTGLGYPSDGSPRRIGEENTYHEAYTTHYSGVCKKCGAKRIDQQIGSEATPDEFVEKMVEVFGHVRRVLRDDGTLWLNLGDSYNGGPPGGSSKKQESNVGSFGSSSRSINLKPGNLVGAPWRVALALQADGWVLRQDIIWHKPSPMPESVRNRCTKSHEYLFLLTKKGSGYFCDMDAIREPNNINPNWNYGSEDFRKYESSIKHKSKAQYEKGKSGWSGFAAAGPDGTGRNKRSVWTVDDHKQLLDWVSENHPELLEEYVAALGNRKDVFKISSESYPGAHFATFPRKLVTPCILAGTSEKGCCSKCRTPWKRIVERNRRPTRPGKDSKYKDQSKSEGVYHNLQRHTTDTKTTGWEAGCDCDVATAGVSSTVPCIVLDPFCGSSTTNVVSLTHNRWSWGIDLSEEYLRNNAIPRIEGALFRVPDKVGLVGREVKTITGGEEI